MLDLAADRYVGEIARRVADRLGSDLAALYLSGSGACGGWAAGASDIDLIVVSARPLPAAARRALVEPLRHRALPCPARGLELVVYDRAAVAAPGRTVPFQLNLNTGSGIEDRVALDAADEPSHWFLIDLAIARDCARPLLGPPPERLIGSVSRPDALRALVDSLDWHAEHEVASANSILNACRGWRYAVEGVWSPKPEAGRWALERGGGAEAIAAAIAVRTGAPAEPDPAAAARLLARARAAILAATV